VTLKTGLRVTQGHRRYHWIRHPWLPINIP